MAFKNLQGVIDEKTKGWFLLKNDGDYADVIFLYRNINDVIIADTHYIKSNPYSGYVHCCGDNCPACAKRIKVQEKLFIPVYNIMDKEVQIWDRSTWFQNQLIEDVFTPCSNPSEYVFRITRHGRAHSMDTKYEIRAISKNNIPYETILKQFNISFPEYLNTICHEVDRVTLNSWINPTYSNPAGVSSEFPSTNFEPIRRNNVDVQTLTEFYFTDFNFDTAKNHHVNLPQMSFNNEISTMSNEGEASVDSTIASEESSDEIASEESSDEIASEDDIIF